MRQAIVSVNGRTAGLLIKKEDGSYLFRYDNEYFLDSSATAISLTLPKSQQQYHSDKLFPFFFNMLSEGINKQVQLQRFKIDEDDYFGLLLATSENDTIGAITLKEVTTKEI